MRLRTPLHSLFQSNSAVSLPASSGHSPAKRQQATARRTQSTFRAAAASSRAETRSVSVDKRIFTTLQTPFRSGTLQTAVSARQHSLFEDMRTLYEAASRPRKTEAICSILRHLAEEDGFYQKAMQVVAENLDQDLFCNLYDLSPEVLAEFQAYDDDIERPSAKVPYYAVVGAIERSMVKLQERLAARVHSHQAEVAKLTQQLSVQAQEIGTLREAVHDLRRRPVSYEEPFRKLEKEVLPTQHNKLAADFEKLRTREFKRKSKGHRLKTELALQKEESAELKTKAEWLTREVEHLTAERERRELKIAALRETVVKRETLFKEVSKSYEAMKAELSQARDKCAAVLAELETERTSHATDLTPRPDWSICPWKWEEGERKRLSSRQLLEELVRVMESRPKFIRKKSMKPAG